MRWIILITATALLTLTFWEPLYCDVIYIPDDSASIQGGIDYATGGDTVIVRPGTYFENIDFRGKEIVVQSEKGPKLTYINGRYLNGVVVFKTAEGSGAVIQGFTLENGRAVNGGGIYCYGSSPLIKENIITNNYATARGGGILADGGFPIIEKNRITSNTVYEYGGGGIYVRNGSCLIAGNEISNNSISLHGAGISTFNTDLYIYHNLILNNYSPANGGGIVTNEATLDIVNNTFCGNTADSNGGGIAITTGSTAIVRNNIVTGNTGSGGIYSGGGSQVTSDYNDVWNNYGGNYKGLYPGVNDISENPLFVGGIPFDYHLSPGSPCIDAGDPLDIPPPRGGARIDIGALEFLYGIHTNPSELKIQMIEGGLEQITDSLFLVSRYPEPVAFELSTDAEWVGLEPSTGELGGWETETIIVTFDGSGLEPRVYLEEINAWFYGATQDTILNVPVSLKKYPIDPVEVELVCEEPSAQRGGFLEFDIVFTNNVEWVVSGDGWLDLTKINGEPYEHNPVLGPGNVTLSPLCTVTMPISLAVPEYAPLGGNYIMRGLIGYYDHFVIDESSFEFMVTP